MIDERGADYVPNDSVNSLSCCINPFGDTSDQIQRDTVIKEVKRRSRSVRNSSLPHMCRFSLRTLDLFTQRRSVPVNYSRRYRADDKVDF